MKKKLKSLALLTLIAGILFSCSKSEKGVNFDDSKIQQKNVNRNNVNLISTLQGSEQKIAYLLLNNDEKAVLWKTKFEAILSNEILNDLQSKFVQKLILQIDNGILNLDDKSNKIKMVDLSKESVALFTYKEAYSLMTTLATTLQAPESNPDYVAPDGIKCNCSKESDWCLTGDCKETDPVCTSKSSCGSLWSYKCDGKCNK